MPNIDQSKPTFGFAPCLEFTWHDQTRRYVRAEESLTIDGNVFSPMPEMEIQHTKQDGGTQDRPVFISVPLTVDPITNMITQTHAEVSCRILEADFTDLAATPRVAYFGVVGKTRARYKGSNKLVRLECYGRKAFFEGVSLGLKATDRCPWFFGDTTCGATVASVSATVNTANGTQLTFSSLPNDTVKGGWPEGRYTRGFVEFEGLRILVRQHHVGSLLFTMSKAPPQIDGHTWAGQAVTVYEGCDKTVLACTAHGRTAFFGGIGLAMPIYNPFLEEPPQ